MKKLICCFLVIFMMSVLLLTGCGTGNESAPEVETTSGSGSASAELEEEEEEEPLVPEEETFLPIGEEEEGAYQIKLTNSTGMDITAVSVKTTEEEEYPDNFLVEEDVFAADEVRYLYYLPPVEEDAETEEVQPEEADDADEADDRELTVGYDVQLTLADDSVYILHGFPFDDVEEAELLLEEDVIYLKYISLSTQETVETREAELAIKAQEEAEAQEQAETESTAETQKKTENQPAQQSAPSNTASESQQTTEPDPTPTVPETTPAEPEQTPAEPDPAPVVDDAQGGNEEDGNDQGCIGDEGLMW